MSITTRPFIINLKFGARRFLFMVSLAKAPFNVENKCFSAIACEVRTTTLKIGLVGGRGFKLIMKRVVRILFLFWLRRIAWLCASRPR